MRRVTLQERLEIFERIDKVPTKQVASTHPLSMDLIKDFTHMPEALMKWGERLLEAGDKKFGVDFINAAVKNAEYDKKTWHYF